MTILQLQTLLASRWPRYVAPGVLRRPSAPGDEGSGVRAGTALPRDVRGGRVFGDRAAPCERAAARVRARAWTMGYLFAETRAPPDVARPWRTWRVPMRSDAAGGILRGVRAARYGVW